ncbi:hypothetical protein AAVH_05943 [Aphelenchoides avenae]|nr:hypothetical protein AAVH_05943 [Aphelenchus avenae]
MAHIGTEPIDINDVNIEAHGSDARVPIRETATAEIFETDDAEAHGPDARAGEDGLLDDAEEAPVPLQRTTMLTRLEEAPRPEPVTDTIRSAQEIEAHGPEARDTTDDKPGQPRSSSQERKDLLKEDDVEGSIPLKRTTMLTEHELLGKLNAEGCHPFMSSDKEEQRFKQKVVLGIGLAGVGFGLLAGMRSRH